MWMKKIKSTITEAFAQATQYCFCSEPTKNETPVLITLYLGDSQTQSMGAHGSCLQEKRHPTVPFVASNEVDTD